MSRLRADTLVNYSGSGTPNFKSGVTGAAVTFTGDVTAANGSFTGNVTIDGNLTYKDVTNVDSVGIITAQEGIQVSANGVNVTGVGTFNNPITVAGIATINGGGLDVTGVITATSYSGDGSSLSGVSPSVSAVASGTIPNGATVVINTDGTVGVVTQTGSADPSAGTPVVFESASSSLFSTVYDSANGKVVIAYRDGGNSNYGTAIVGTVSGTSISFGSPVVFDSTAAAFISAIYDSSNEKVVIAYRDDGNSFYGTAIVGTVSGTSISFGSAVIFNSASSSDIGATFDSTNGKVVIAYRDSGNSSYGTAIVGTVSGTSISFGSETVFESATTFNSSLTFDSSNGKVVIAYRDSGNSDYGTAIVGTVSGTSISFGSATVFESANTQPISPVFDSANNKVVIAYRDLGNSSYGTAIVGTVSGTSISFGTAVVFKSASSSSVSASYDSTNEKVVIAYRDGGNSNYGTAIMGTVSGTSISFGSEVVFESGTAQDMSLAYDSSSGKTVIAYEDASNSSYGTAAVFSHDTLATNLTSTNFLGFSNAAYTDGQTATVQIAGAVDDAQSGLTTASVHYVQNDGTLSTTAGTPSVEAGLALSATEIAIKA